MSLTYIYVFVVIFISTIIRSTFGFGEALFSVPLLVLCVPLKIAAPLTVLVSITIASIVVMQDFRKIHLHGAVGLVLPTFFGIPIGLFLLTSAYEDAVKAALAILLIAFSVYSLIGRAPPELRHESLGWLLCCGFCAGILGGAYGMNGPPLVIYGTMRRWSAQHFRATLQGYFLPASLIGMLGYWSTGLLSAAVIHYYLLSFTSIIPAVLIGRTVNRCFNMDDFRKYVYLFLATVGSILLIQSLK